MNSRYTTWVNDFESLHRGSMKLLVLACLLSCAAGQSLFPRLPSSVWRKTGATLTSSERIVGGSEAVPNEFPWQISLQRRSGAGWAHHCGGSVYSKDYIIDAAHCVDGLLTSSLRVVAAEHSLSTTSGFEQHRYLSFVRMHENYDPETFANDIALLRMNEPLNFSSGQVGSISLPAPGSNISAGTTCLVSGWGTTFFSGSISDVLLKVAIPIVSNRDCNSMYGFGSILPSMICAGFVAGGADSCQGDSGGPLVTLKPSVLVGVVSWGQGCASPGYPGVYTDVASFVGWITSNAV